MNAVGIDVSKGKSMVAVVQPMGVVAVKPYNVPHTSGDLRKLVSSLKKLEGETRIVMECTGRYHEPIAQALNEAGLYVCTVNPLLIHNYGNNSIRNVKTDKADALKIARYAIDNWAELREYSPMEDIRQKLKTFSRQYDLYSKSMVAYKNNIIALLDQSFPGVNTLFSSPLREDGHQKWVDFAETFWHCDCVRGLSEKTFSARYQKWCKRHGYYFTSKKAAQIYAFSLDLIATVPKNATTKLLITQAAAQLTQTSQVAETFRQQMQALAAQLPEYPVVMAMYGVGDTLGPQLMAEIGDVCRFESKRSLVAFAGVDPSSKQSGKHEAKSNPVSKRGSSQLRKCLFLVMLVLLQRKPVDEPVYQFLDKKRSEGKPYLVYMTAGANKFLRIYYARVKEYLGTLDMDTML